MPSASRAATACLLGAVLLALPLAPAAPFAEADALTVPAPRAGETARTLQWTNHSGVATGSSLIEVHARWGEGVVPARDGWDRERLAYAVIDEPTCAPGVACVGPRTRFISPDGRDLVVEHGESWRGSGFTWLGVLGTRLVQQRLTVEHAALYAGGVPVLHALQGATLHAGQAWTIEAPPSPARAEGVLVPVRPHGWEEHEGRTLFRVEMEVDGRAWTLWYDGTAPLPAHATSTHGSWLVQSVEIRLDRNDRGSGAELALHAPPPAAPHVRAAPRADVGPDGPQEQGIAAFPLAHAAALARADGEVTAWLAGDPDAFVAWALGYEDRLLQRTGWALVFVKEGDVAPLYVRVEGVLTPAGGAAFEVVERQLAEGLLAAPRAEVVGASVACFAAAREAAETRAGTHGPQAPTLVTAVFSALRDGPDALARLRCEHAASEEAPTGASATPRHMDLAAREVVLDHATRHRTRFAEIDALSGGIVAASEGGRTARAATTVDLV